MRRPSGCVNYQSLNEDETMKHPQLAFLINHNLLFGTDFMAKPIASARSDLKAFPYPPTDILMHGDNDFEIQMALAGYDENNIDVSVEGKRLTISGRPTAHPEGTQFYARGISRKEFTHAFEFAHPVEVEATFKQGMLIVRAKAIIPEAEKPRTIKVTAA
jgi:HSP20 family molecular chaperone IbpA